jgi:hypothetical protein
VTENKVSASSLDGFTLPLGVSMTTGRRVALRGEEVMCGIFYSGANGSGKTEAGIKPMIESLFTSGTKAGALICNVKDSYGEYVTSLAERYGQQDRVIHLKPGGNDRMNILTSRLSPEAHAQTLVAATQDFKTHDQFWPRSAVILFGNLLGCLRLAYGDDQVTMTDVARICDIMQAFVNKSAISRRNTIPPELEFVFKIAASRIEVVGPALERRTMRKRLNKYVEVITRWCGLADKTFSSVASCLQVTLQAVAPEPIAAVLAADKRNANFEGVHEVLNGKIVVCDFSPQKDGLIGRMAAAALKRQLFAAALTERYGQPSNTLRPCFFIADEAQTFLSLDDDQFSDYQFSAICRSLRLGLCLAVQSVDALMAAAGPNNEAAVHVLLRNLRTHLYLRQDSSPALERAMLDRGLSSTVVHCVPNLNQFHAFISRKGDYEEEAIFDQCRLMPAFLRSTVETGNDGLPPDGDRHRLPTTVRRWVDDALTDRAAELAGAFPQCLLVSSDTAALRTTLGWIDSTLRRHGILTVRIDAEDLDTLDPAMMLVTAAGWAPSVLSHSAILIDSMDKYPGDPIAAKRLRRLFERRALDPRVPGVEFDFSRTLIICSIKDKARNQMGFTTSVSNFSDSSGRIIDPLFDDWNSARGIVVNLDDDAAYEKWEVDHAVK